MIGALSKGDLMNLKEYMETRNIEKKEFAHIIGISEPALHNYLAGRRMPPLDVAMAIEARTRGKVTASALLEYYEHINCDRVRKAHPVGSSAHNRKRKFLTESETTEESKVVSC
jgi:DNA-binding transcriptional regulator YdaS (Cro superfamily)